jgi:toxin ParE1/3/4
MTFEVLLTEQAVQDLDEIVVFVQERDGQERALDLLQNIESVFWDLAEFPSRGVWLKELVDLGIREFREVFFKPYRIIYRVMESKVFVLIIADGRRDLNTLLLRRLLDAKI